MRVQYFHQYLPNIRAVFVYIIWMDGVFVWNLHFYCRSSCVDMLRLSNKFHSIYIVCWRFFCCCWCSICWREIENKFCLSSSSKLIDFLSWKWLHDLTKNVRIHCVFAKSPYTRHLRNISDIIVYRRYAIRFNITSNVKYVNNNSELLQWKSHFVG